MVQLCTYICLFQGSYWLVDAIHKFADMLKMSGHLCCQHHVDHGLPQRPELVPARGEADNPEYLIQHAAISQRGVQERRVPVSVLEDVALAVPDGELEGQGGVVALQHGRVVVEDGQVAPGVAQEGVGPPWVVHIVHRGRDQSRHLVQLVQTALDRTAGTGPRYQDSIVWQG